RGVDKGLLVIGRHFDGAGLLVLEGAIMVDEPKPEDLAKLLAAATNWSRILFDAYSLAVAGFIANILFASGTRPTDRELREMIEAFVPEGDNPPGIHKS